ncbi:MAG: DUF2914 domain-containing protein [Chitinispirillaceae bacterium]|nr:DUF2914 domain-containing protein [Chitinispirillaceae bacterium]
MRTITLMLSSAIIWSVVWAQQPASSTPAPPANTEAVEKKAEAVKTDAVGKAAPAVKAETAKKEAKAATAPPASGLSVTKASVAVGLEEYEPVEPGDLFPADIKRLYCFSQVKGASDSTEIEHRWYWNDDMIAAIPLKVKSNNWRTYSIKTIPAGMTGEWMVAIVNPQKEEEVLKTLKFSVK